ncbi:putative Phosphatidate cytidylyltransferase [Desulfamplus magnetovallimortis]|uniref:Phosphatidate cytidylyltransferase n=1 Tax=Desulfamplus magnetovallimortis TaxID=1246637 RepID=A0A1W1HAL5_9BACT|nr:phosphatidate cytidylyltransferase [Desulfamplus magnetovallimortis]SLM29486.1 putative Phosphatidate cytidylyltransferase [Desulfamplus magnetovallimortis]
MILRFYVAASILVGIFCAFGWILKKRELFRRTASLLVMVNIFSLFLIGGEYLFGAFIFTLLGVGVYEMTGHVETNHFWGISMALVLSLVLSYQMNWIRFLIPFYLCVSLFAFAGKKAHVASKSYIVLFITAVLVPCSVSLVGIYRFDPGWVIALILLLQLNDSAAYLFGKSLGKTRIFKTISPNKSLEGYLFGTVGIVLGVLLLLTVIPLLKGYSPFEILSLGTFIFIFGNAGDLLFSAIKRKLDIKDFSNLIPGHGGVLDRLDNILFAAPMFYLFLQGI